MSAEYQARGRRLGSAPWVACLLLLGPASPAAAQTASGASLVERPARLVIAAAPLETALGRLQASSGVRIAYSAESLPEEARVSCDCAESTVGEALATLLNGTDLTYVTRASHILIVLAPRGRIGAANDSGGVVGSVHDAESGLPIAAASVSLAGTGQVATTGEDGAFLFADVPPGSYMIRAAAVGYRQAEATRADVRSDVRTTVTVILEAAPLALAEIVVAPGTFDVRGEEFPLLRQTLTRAEMDALPQLGEDAFRVLERLPGIATGDISAKMQVRGGHDDELMIALDGVELFEPYHMKDLDSVLGILDVQALGSMSLLAGGVTAEHGDRLSGLLDLRTRQPRVEGNHHSLGLSVSSLSARSQGTFDGGRGAWLASARRGFLDLLLELAQTDEDNEQLSPQYFDVLGKVDFLVGTRHRLGLHVLHAGDNLDLEEIDGPDDLDELHTDWRNTNAWLTWDWAAGEALDVTTTASLASLSRSRQGQVDARGASQHADFVLADDRGDFDFLTLRQDWLWAPADAVLLKFGGEVRDARARYDYRRETGQEIALEDGAFGFDLDTLVVALESESTEASAYFATRLQPANPLVVEVGGRYDHRSHSGDDDFAPRVHASLELGGGATLRGSWGVYHQSHGVEELSVVDGERAYFPSERATQWAAGLQLTRGSLDARLEAYRRTIEDPRPRYLNVIRQIIPFPEAGNDRVRFLPERGRADGIELMLSAKTGARSAISTSYILARAEDRLEGRWVPRTFDQRHTVNARWHHSPNERWDLAAGWQYHTGWPNTPMEFVVDTVSVEPNGLDLIVDERPGPVNSVRLPAYHRMDFRATRSFSVGDGTLRAFVDLFNLYGRENLRSFDYKIVLPEGRAIANPGETLLPFLPSFGLTWEF
ncbi:MAG: TonB-dependent receptor [Gemmatimonadota bacterium]